MNAKEQIECVNKLYKTCNTIDYKNANSNDAIQLFRSWYRESIVLFRRYFDANDPDVIKFEKEDASGNGYVLFDIFQKLSGTFLVLIGKIENKNSHIMDKKNKNIFIVHGHSNVKNEIVNFINDELEIKTITLESQINNGASTIIQKLERYSKEVSCAVVILSPDDIGKKNTKRKEELKPRARQNVIFECGYFIGKIGRDKVVLILEKDVEKPSDLDGVLHIDYSSQWKNELGKNIKAIFQENGNN